MAYKEFPSALKGVSASRVHFFIQATMNGSNRRKVRISESAWESVVSPMRRGEVVDIQVKPVKENFEFKSEC